VVAGGQRSGSATLGTFEQTRPMVAAQAIGIARAALEYATAYATEREAFGGPIIDNQGISFPLAELATQIDAARLLTWRASWMAANGVPFERGEGSMSKLAASEVAVKATERAIQTMGGWGYITDHPVEKWYRDAKLYTIFEGTSEIQRMVISNALGAAVGTPPLHVVLEPSGGPINRMFGRGTPLRSRAADVALSMQDRVPEPVMRLAMKVLRPPGR
jgi:alkylation response protein AidB-like acyl-CoA dehydrogenase